MVFPAVPWCPLQACSAAGKNEEAVQGMEQLCGVKALAAGSSVVHTTQAAGVSLEARLQVSHVVHLFYPGRVVGVHATMSELGTQSMKLVQKGVLQTGLLQRGHV